MTIREIRGELRKSPMSAWYFIQGSLRFIAYKNKWLRWMLRSHIIEQFEWRIKKAQACYWNGSCRCCGCKFPDLAFADKACAAGDTEKYAHCQKRGLTQCYPKMQNKKRWESLYKNS